MCIYMHMYSMSIYAFVKSDISNSLYSSNYALEGELQCMYTRIYSVFQAIGCRVYAPYVLHVHVHVRLHKSDIYYKLCTH